MIDDCARHDPEVACWDEEGNAFSVYDTVKFSKSYLPKYFKHSKFPSFVRQLNLYGFRNINSECSSNPVIIMKMAYEKTLRGATFRHQNFRRGRQDLLLIIKRAPVKKEMEKEKHKAKEKGKESELQGSSSSSLIPAINKRLELVELGLRDVSSASKTSMDEMSIKLDYLISLMSNANSNSNVTMPEIPVYIKKNHNTKSSKRPRQEKSDGNFRIESPVSESDASDEIALSSTCPSSVPNDTILRNPVCPIAPAAIIGSDVSKMDAIVEEERPVAPAEITSSNISEIDAVMEEESKPCGICAPRGRDDFHEFIDSSGIVDCCEDYDVALSIDEASLVNSGDTFTNGSDEEQQMSEHICTADGLVSKMYPETINGEYESTNEACAVLIHHDVQAESAMNETDVDQEYAGTRPSDAIVVAVEVPTRAKVFRKISRRLVFALLTFILLVLVINVIMWPILLMARYQGSPSSSSDDWYSSHRGRRSSSQSADE